MSPRFAFSLALLGLVFGQHVPVLAQPAVAQTPGPTVAVAPTDGGVPVSAIQAQAMADQTLASFSPSDAFLTQGATRMGSLGVVTTRVNGQSGNVSLPTYARQISAGTPVASNGTANFTFPAPFNNLPTCFAEVQSTSTDYVFSAPQITSKTTAAVAMLILAIPKAVAVNSLGATLPLVQSPPAGTSLNITCIAPN